jgi:hypothetical protein
MRSVVVGSTGTTTSVAAAKIGAEAAVETKSKGSEENFKQKLTKLTSRSAFSKQADSG